MTVKNSQSDHLPLNNISNPMNTSRFGDKQTSFYVDFYTNKKKSHRIGINSD